MTPGAAPTTAVVVCNGTTVALTYWVGADPQVPDSTGSRFFGTNSSGTISVDRDAAGDHRCRWASRGRGARIQ